MTKQPLRMRRPCTTVQIASGYAVTVGFDPDTLKPVEVFITQRGKASNSEMEQVLYDIGVEASKLMQQEDMQ